MNLQNMQTLHDWLMAGAPHVGAFDMHRSIDLDFNYSALDEEGEPACGTVCCIAGAAALFAKGDGKMPDPINQRNLSRLSWPAVRRRALDWLGLEAKEGGLGIAHIGHDLFDMDLAPEDCTPTQAAAAVRRVMRGDLPWPDTQLIDQED